VSLIFSKLANLVQTRLYNTIKQASNLSTSITRDLMASGVSSLG
jgi:hypothetical protein